MIKAILFDYDGVLTLDKTGALTTNRYLSKATGLQFDAVEKAFGVYNADLNLGRITYHDIWKAVCEDLQFDINISLLEQAFLSTPLNDELIALARKLKADYAVGIITDNKRDRIDCLRKAQGLDSLFDPIIVSAEQGESKQNAAIFQHALRYLGVEPAEVVFLDNTPSNLVAPRVLGMHTVFHDDVLNDVQGTIAKLGDLGVHVS